MAKRGPKTEAGLQAVSEHGKSLDHAAWTKNEKAVEAIERAKRLRQTKHGMYASVPIICKAEACPYAHSCPLMQEDPEIVPYGEKCPIEIAAIEDLFNRYCQELMIDPSDPRNTVDLMQVKDLVDADIGVLRCDQKIAWDADYIIENTVGVDEDGNALTKQELHPITEYKEKLINRKHKTWQLLNSTRKDKAGSKITVHTDPSERAAEMLKVKEIIGNSHEDDEKQKKAYYERMRRYNSNDQEENSIIDIEPIEYEEGEE